MNEGNVDAHRQLCDYIQGEMEELKGLLSPKRKDFDAKTNHPTSFTQAEIAWASLRDATKNSANIAWKDLMRQANERRPDRGEARERWQASLDLQAATCRRLLRLWMEASLYRLRVLSNFEYLGISHRQDGIEAINRKRVYEVRKVIRDYQRGIHYMDTQAKRMLGRHVLGYWFEDADHVALLSNAFGPSQVVVLHEPGWAQVAGRAREQLNYMSRELRRKAYLQKQHYFSACGLLLWRAFTRYGIQNWRLAIWPVLVLFASLAGYYVDSRLTSAACAPSQATTLGDYIAYTLAVLTGSGQSVPVPCGLNIQAIATAESVLGYLSLALLASLLFELLNRDRFR
jgi:hypothetical protein